MIDGACKCHLLLVLVNVGNNFLWFSTQVMKQTNCFKGSLLYQFLAVRPGRKDHIGKVVGPENKLPRQENMNWFHFFLKYVIRGNGIFVVDLSLLVKIKIQLTEFEDLMGFIK